MKKNKNFIKENKANLAASIQRTIVEILMDKLETAATSEGVKQVAIAGGVAANSELREKFIKKGEQLGWRVFIPEFQFTTDNAAMIAIAGYYKYLEGEFASQDAVPYARSSF